MISFRVSDDGRVQCCEGHPVRFADTTSQVQNSLVARGAAKRHHLAHQLLGQSAPALILRAVPWRCLDFRVNCR